MCSPKLTRHICVSCASEFAALPSYRGTCRECSSSHLNPRGLHIEVKPFPLPDHSCSACRGQSWTPWSASDVKNMDTRHCRFCGFVEWTRNDQ